MFLDDFFEKNFENAGEIDKYIIYLEENQPDLRTKEGKEWLTRINHLYTLYNKATGEKIYKML